MPQVYTMRLVGGPMDGKTVIRGLEEPDWFDVEELPPASLVDPIFYKGRSGRYRRAPGTQIFDWEGWR